MEGAEPRGHPGAELRKALDALRGRAGLLLEVKDPGRYPGIERLLVAELEAAGWLGRVRLDAAGLPDGGG